ncbi:hypothetical protein Rs2_41018 [Raphanus sativus]|nr:hypothetical protein Rs2_41018 [Raphanus sativus]
MTWRGLLDPDDKEFALFSDSFTSAIEKLWELAREVTRFENKEMLHEDESIYMKRKESRWEFSSENPPIRDLGVPKTRLRKLKFKRTPLPRSPGVKTRSSKGK